MNYDLYTSIKTYPPTGLKEKNPAYSVLQESYNKQIKRWFQTCIPLNTSVLCGWF